MKKITLITVIFIMITSMNITSHAQSGGGAKKDSWHYNTGTSLPQEPNYCKYHLLEKCKPGDILFEAKGNHGITGHCAIVEGKFYDPIKKKHYIRIVEGLSYGISRSVLDDDRLDNRAGYIYRIKNASEIQKQAAIDFCISQLGKPYKFGFSKDHHPTLDVWYCSQLLWAGYKNIGIDIETNWIINEPGVTPRDITMYSNKAMPIYVR